MKNFNIDRILAIYTIIIIALSAGHLWNKLFPIILLPFGILFYSYIKYWQQSKK